MEKTLVFALSSSVELANEIVAELGLPLAKCEVKTFCGWRNYGRTWTVLFVENTLHRSIYL